MEHYFITGVSSGIGLALVQELLAHKDKIKVYGLARRDPGLKDHRFHFFPCDLTEVDSLYEKATNIFNVSPQDNDRLVLINNAGTLGEVAFIGQQSASHYAHTFAVNAVSPMIMCDAFIQQFQSFEGEKIIFNISSGAASKDIEGWAAYCASKAALDRFTTVCVKEQTHAHNQVHIHSVSPGVVDTAMQYEIRNSSEEKFPSLSRFVELHRNGELIPPSLAAKKLIYLLDTPSLRVQTFLSLRDL